MDIQIKTFNVVGVRRCQRRGNENCPICRQPLTQNCLECVENCFVSTGSCGHSFHRCCVRGWTQIRNVCPLDQELWIAVWEEPV